MSVKFPFPFLESLMRFFILHTLASSWIDRGKNLSNSQYNTKDAGTHKVKNEG